MDPQKRERLGVDLARQQTRLVRELKAVRVASGLTVADVAESMEVDEAMVYRFEKGSTNPTLATIRRYALAVGAMLDLSAKSLSDHTKTVVHEAANVIERDPAKQAAFTQFHAVETTAPWLRSGPGQDREKQLVSAWTVGHRV
ncbi:helix-turn-helix transcriptional regulator [Rhodococcus sp. ARC_M6]|uniref:helix-turn-helix domain-containing protein n=1 Tax=Rhodococcus sp. ARC_M6 TaxID=2928852 RepID=UPI001FB2B1F1|nr:helix-turn-helix transcriptional regulator [Rhodococcus sp. ARC_M6]MCJ0906098.1 helix-turn-helix domain-containing protein [Rhodococcus sp. ARC_M6]